MLPHDNSNNFTYLLFQDLELFQADKECLLWSQKRDHLIFQIVKGYSDLAAFKKTKKGGGEIIVLTYLFLKSTNAIITELQCYH